MREAIMDKRILRETAFAVIALFVVCNEPSRAADQDSAQKPGASKPTEVEVETWRQRIINTPQPKVGCFTASYPQTAWTEVPCSYEPMKTRLPKRGGGMLPEIVGNGQDFVAVTAAHISEAEGRFDSVTVTSETQTNTLVSPPVVVPNAYGLQLNTEFFDTSACSTSPYRGAAYMGTPYYNLCKGWEQFLWSSFGGTGIQYWLLGFGPAGTLCPSPRSASCDGTHTFHDGWCEFPDASGIVSCAVNGASVHAFPASVTLPLDITQIGQVKLRGRSAGVGGSTTDASIATFGTSVFTAPGGNFFPDLGTQWQQAEFNLVGSCCGLQADLNSGASMTVHLSITDGTMNPPTCHVDGFTGETNNMTMVDFTGPILHSGFPSIIFTETNNGLATMPACTQAVTVGDTHITTFDGAYYDFQASGDFILAEDGSNFVVQARQASGAPTWPNAAVNKAIATRMGATRVAIYIEPTRVDIDGVTTAIADGTGIQRPGGVQVTRRGNVYWVTDAQGNSVRVTLNASWIDVKVGLGTAMHTPVRGLLGNPNGNGQELFTRENVALREPVLFQDLYGPYAESWRVDPKESLFTGDTRIRFGIPLKPFYAKDLPRDKAAHAATVCKEAGIKEGDMFDSCVLDTAVIGDKAAAKIFTRIATPKHVIKPVLRKDAKAS
jgi:hypothetical protein